MNYPQFYNEEYLKELEDEGKIVNIPKLNDLNRKVVEAYNLLSSNFSKSHSSYFNLVIGSYFSNISTLRLQYICNAFIEIDRIVFEYQEKQSVIASQKKEISNKLKKMTG